MVIYRMNVDLAGHKKGDWWEKGKEPYIVTKWVELGGGVFNEAPIILIEKGEADIHGSTVVCPKCGHEFDESKKDNPKASEPEKIVVPDKEPVVDTKSLQELNQEKMNKLFDKEGDIEAPELKKCKGFKGDGSPCEWTGNRVRENGYCFMHQDQYKGPEGGES